MTNKEATEGFDDRTTFTVAICECFEKAQSIMAATVAATGFEHNFDYVDLLSRMMAVVKLGRFSEAAGHSIEKHHGGNEIYALMGDIEFLEHKDPNCTVLPRLQEIRDRYFGLVGNGVPEQMYK